MCLWVLLLSFFPRFDFCGFYGVNNVFCSMFHVWVKGQNFFFFFLFLQDKQNVFLWWLFFGGWWCGLWMTQIFCFFFCSYIFFDLWKFVLIITNTSSIFCRINIFEIAYRPIFMESKLSWNYLLEIPAIFFRSIYRC